MIASLVTGAVLGLSIAAPFGPISLLCIQRSIAINPGLGVATGLGASSVHVFYATLAVTSARAVAAELVNWNQPVRVLCCVILVLLGVRLLVRRPAGSRSMEPICCRRAFASSFALALFNPLTVLPYLVVASGGAAIGPTGTALTLSSVPGVFLGTALWYAALSGGAALFRSSLPPSVIQSLNQVAGALLIGFGLLTALR